MWRIVAVGILSFFLSACSSDPTPPPSGFELIGPESGIDFSNDLTYSEEFNPYTYRNFFNGAGVALGDVNNDGLLDVYLTGNMVDNKLYINKGDWKFEDVTERAGVACKGVWSTGATFVDINADGLLDIYVCKSGMPGGPNRYNELFINQGDMTFTEESKMYGLDINGLSVHAAFFDYDKDGDLDCYVLTNSIRSVGGYDLIEGQRNIPDPQSGGNKFLLNDGSKFVDYTAEAGVYRSQIGFGLGITLGDFNLDGWTDMFISNDFFERDYFYINNQKGGFVEKLADNFSSISMGSMGADAADLDNDQYPDIMVTEMLPATIERQRTKQVFESWDKYALSASKGYFHQFARNALHRNIGEEQFVEISRFSGVSATEWSWGSLIFDMNNDGLKDIFISNGIYKDLLDRDYLTYMANEEQVRSLIKSSENAIMDLIDIMPSSPVSNFAFMNEGGFQFTNMASEWNLDQASFSNGSAYGDLDNDGDLDLVVNNVNMPTFIYRNNIDTSANRSIRLSLRGKGNNTMAIGAKVEAVSGDQRWVVENFPSRGFQSSVDPVLHIGVGNQPMLDSLFIYWPNGGLTSMSQVSTNRLYELNEPEEVSESDINAFIDNGLTLKPLSLNEPYVHQENNFIDFDRERLLPQMFNNEGPPLAVGDVNSDGLLDFYVGGAKGTTGALYLGSEATFTKHEIPDLETLKSSEDTDALFLDVDSDGDLDLIITSGGRQVSRASETIWDRLYSNDGQGNFQITNDRIPQMFFSSSSIDAADFDKDGDLDLFIGERFDPFHYGMRGKGILLLNDGKGYFKQKPMPALDSLGMVTDAHWGDLNGDDWPDLVVSAEWKPITVLINENGKSLINRTSQYGLDNSRGLWNEIELVDLDNDGDVDILAGNHGRNSFFQPGSRMYINDFDGNGAIEQIFCHERNGKYYPIHDRDELIMQLPYLKKKILYFKDYASASMSDIFDSEVLDRSIVFETDLMESVSLFNAGETFEVKPLPPEAQYAPVYAFEVTDINLDGIPDVLLGGNQYLVKPQFGRYGASQGLLLYGVTKNGFNFAKPEFLGIKGQIRDIKLIPQANRDIVVFGINNQSVEIYEVVR